MTNEVLLYLGSFLLLLWGIGRADASIIDWRQQGGRESGGRPAWFATVEANGRTAAYYVRGDRALVPMQGRTHPLDREFRLLQELNKTDVQYLYRHAVVERWPPRSTTDGRHAGGRP